MSDPFVAEIRVFGFNFAPKGWAFCEGQLLPLSQNTALFSLLGTMYGGNGKSNFALPNLIGSVPVCHGQGQGLTERYQGETGGTESVTLIASEIPMHSHSLRASDERGESSSPSQAYPGTGTNMYASTADTQMAPTALAPAGGSLPHNNLMPSLVMNFCIALQGVFPQRG